MMIPTFTLRVLIVAVSATAILLAALVNPTPKVAAVVINGIYVAVIVAACVAVGTPQPARSFWLGFAIACTGFLLLDKLSQRRFIDADLFTRKLVTGVEDWLPPIVHRGPPGTTRYFRSDGRFPVYYHRFNEEGKQTGHGQMTLETAKVGGAFKGDTSLDDLPHIDNVPTNYMRSQMLPYWLAGVFGIAGGLLSYVVRRRTTQRPESAQE